MAPLATQRRSISACSGRPDPQDDGRQHVRHRRMARHARKEDPNEFFNFHPPLVMDPTDMQRLYFASTRVWRTTDGATTWNPISPHFGVDAVVRRAGARRDDEPGRPLCRHEQRPAGADDERDGGIADLDGDAGERAPQPDVHRDRDDAGRSRHRLRHRLRLRSGRRHGARLQDDRLRRALVEHLGESPERARQRNRDRLADVAGDPVRRRPTSASSGLRTAA